MNTPLSVPCIDRLSRHVNTHIRTHYQDRIALRYDDQSPLRIDGDKLVAILNELPPHLTEFVYTRYELDMSFTDIGRELNIPKGVVRQYDGQLWDFLSHLSNLLRYVDDPSGIVRMEALDIIHAQDDTIVFAQRAIEQSTLTNEHVRLESVPLDTLRVVPEKSVLHLPIKPALYAYLHHHGLDTIPDFKRRGRKQLRALRGMGPKRLYHLETLLRREGIALEDEPEPLPRRYFELTRPVLTKNDVIERIRAVENGTATHVVLHRYTYDPYTVRTGI